MLYNYVFWFVIIAIILTVIYICSNYDLKGKEKLGSQNDSISEETSTESFTELYDITVTDTSEDVDFEYRSIEQLPSISNDDNFDIDFKPKLPKHIEDPNYRPEFFYNSKNPSEGETECKEAAKRIFGVPFYTIRPDWLKNKRNMEIDCYAEVEHEGKKLRIGIEYHGMQHYRVVKRFHPNGVEDLQEQIRRDHLKLDLCDKNGVYLIIVPYNVKIDKIEDFIRHSDPRAVIQRERLAAMKI